MRDLPGHFCCCKIALWLTERLLSCYIVIRDLLMPFLVPRRLPLHVSIQDRQTRFRGRARWNIAWHASEERASLNKGTISFNLTAKAG